MKQYFIVSDIHAHYDLLIDALDQKSFDVRNPDHILVIAGDILDRGDQGDEVVRFLELLIIKHRLLGVVGNHDVFLIDILNGQIDLKTIEFNIHRNGFYKTLKLGMNPEDESRERTIELIEEIKDHFYLKYPVFVDWLMSLPNYLEFENHVIVHAFLDFSLKDWRDTPRRFAVWERRYSEMIPETFSKNLVFGHTPNVMINNQNDIIFEGKKIMIDGGAAGNLQINVLVLNENEI